MVQFDLTKSSVLNSDVNIAFNPFSSPRFAQLLSLTSCPLSEIHKQERNGNVKVILLATF